MTEYKLYGKTAHIKEEIKEFARSLGGFAKWDNMWRIVLTSAKVTKGRVKKIEEFASINGLKCYIEEYDGSSLAPKDVSYSGFARML